MMKKDSLIILLLFFLIGIANGTKNRLMSWLCLEFCDESKEQITFNLNQINKYKDLFSAVSFEKYTLGPNSTLVDNNLTSVNTKISQMGLESWPLLSSYPHPPEFIEWMREVFQNPEPFFSSCVFEAFKFNYTGYNLDWEPTENVTEVDGLQYAVFIDKFSKHLHSFGIKLSVDFASWSTIWNIAALEKTDLDRAISMGTYTSTDSLFVDQLNTLMTTFGQSRSGAGMETVNATSGEPMSLEEVQFRFDKIKESNCHEVDLWKSPIPIDWFPIIRNYVYGTPI